MRKRLSPIQERFCALYIALGNASEAYRQAGYHSKNADVCSAKLLVTAGIENRLSELKAKNEAKTVMKREEALMILAEIARSTCDEWTKQSDRERAIEILARMCGWNEAEKFQLAASNSLTTYLLDLRTKPIAGEVIELENGQ